MIPKGPIAARVLWIVQKPSAAITIMLPLAFGVWMYLTRSDPAQIDAVMGAALMVHMFAVSTGYRDRLRRGYFDAILVAPSSRVSVAWAHWVVSIAPGLLVWLAIALVDLWARPGRVPTGFTLPALAALLWVSTAAWAISLPTRRYAGGGLWLVALVALAATRELGELRAAFLTAGEGWMAAGRAAGCAGVLPLLLLSDPSSVRTQAIVVAGASVVLAAGIAFICRVDAPLQDSM